MLTLWRQQERQRAAETLADDLLTRARAGDVSLEALARQTPGVTLEPLGPVTRSGQSGLGPDAAAQEPAPRPLVTALFDTQPGALARVALDDGAAVLKVEKAEAPAADVATRERDAVAQALRQSVADDLLNGFTDALAAQVGVTVNQGVLNDALQPVR
ncbi:hypothetical protein [Pararhodospirillum photometricum]|uniref:hypothetical protein n=1 Tax=Pararhodospirillum photometricum TaxID=1084 RepID=UPI0009DB5BC8|nr:hypothetical protein [Pararhodospirillum photometricum]